MLGQTCNAYKFPLTGINRWIKVYLLNKIGDYVFK